MYEKKMCAKPMHGPVHGRSQILLLEVQLDSHPVVGFSQPARILITGSPKPAQTG